MKLMSLHALSEYWIYALPPVALAYLWWSRRSASVADVKALLERGAQIVDVRTAAEFKAATHPPRRQHPSRSVAGAPGGAGPFEAGALLL